MQAMRLRTPNTQVEKMTRECQVGTQFGVHLRAVLAAVAALAQWAAPFASITREGIKMKSRIRNTARCASAAAVLAALTACGGGDSGPPPPPPPATYTVGGTVTGLSGSGLVLQNGGGADLPISASGTFTFATRMLSGTSYSVTVKTSPTAPLELCRVTPGQWSPAVASASRQRVIDSLPSLLPGESTCIC
jgi:hypothetical protein